MISNYAWRFFVISQVTGSICHRLGIKTATPEVPSAPAPEGLGLGGALIAFGQAAHPHPPCHFRLLLKSGSLNRSSKM